MKLCPNNAYQHEVLHMLDSETIKWEDVIPIKRPCEAIYKLYIASSLFMDVSAEEKELFDGDEFYSSEARVLWKTRFYTKGGMDFLSQVRRCDTI